MLEFVWMRYGNAISCEKLLIMINLNLITTYYPKHMDLKIWKMCSWWHIPYDNIYYPNPWNHVLMQCMDLWMHDNNTNNIKTKSTSILERRYNKPKKHVIINKWNPNLNISFVLFLDFMKLYMLDLHK